MRFHRPLSESEKENARPCRHMRVLVSGLADGTLRGLARWFAAGHVSRCPRCEAALRVLKRLRERLLRLGSRSAEQEPHPAAPQETLPPERWAALEAALTEADRESGPPQTP